MTTREEFEEWAEKMGMDLSTAFFIENAAYLDDDTDLAFRAWQASRAAALEEAAKECDLMMRNYEYQASCGDNTGASDFRADAAEQCALGIRALK